MAEIAPVTDRSTGPTDDLTSDELRFMRETHDLEGCPRCPDCGIGNFLVGPQGGGSVNVECEHCGTRLNAYGLTWAHRIGPPGEGLMA